MSKLPYLATRDCELPALLREGGRVLELERVAGVVSLDVTGHRADQVDVLA